MKKEIKKNAVSPAGKKGFTLLEILLVVAAIAILAGIVIIALNPNKQIGDTRNSQRWSDVNTILNAVYQYAIDNNGDLPAGIGAAAADICNTADDLVDTPCADDSLVDLGVLFEDEKYLTSIPSDPQCDSSTIPTTCYTIRKTGNNRVAVSAPDAEQSMTITVSK